MIEKTYTITSEEGLHARPAAKLVAAVSPFASDVRLVYLDREVNLKSIMGVMSLGISGGKTFRVVAVGADEKEVIAKVDEVLKAEGLAE